ncbi:hypothetical protein D3C85_680390 [compost metagenome]
MLEPPEQGLDTKKLALRKRASLSASTIWRPDCRFNAWRLSRLAVAAACAVEVSCATDVPASRAPRRSQPCGIAARMTRRRSGWRCRAWGRPRGARSSTTAVRPGRTRRRSGDHESSGPRREPLLPSRSLGSAAGGPHVRYAQGPVRSYWIGAGAVGDAVAQAYIIGCDTPWGLFGPCSIRSRCGCNPCADHQGAERGCDCGTTKNACRKFHCATLPWNNLHV